MKENEIHTIDIRDKKCPMTTVYIRTKFDSIDAGDKLEIILKGHETRKNVQEMLRFIPCIVVKDFDVYMDDNSFSGLIEKE
ncbi:hypothetical protein AA106555_0344 [Neokomagataea thailandica NBRC 106555]|uniref:Sulfurtransferase TusA family protein n=2 Tax=Neokomagataea TaxID=1223423 RepID=A0A4Y6V725_9PROT|nr:sulfurtransferase TusA family protein [Neokomagataea tanensis]QDH24431.1 sulfurtransferase TusA family protein [Neokomagataea tanensis]GBR50831.1 hypothetical protein AA106555_0344 [Neokomagataea thailandica NBRC 106555]